ncbi:signal peptidase II [Aquamicrobium segne]|uniref:Lipoprotein signal peptidase n=1 Tax=Aquamicrobium segne TaxID=469547 RepID=A0ABW0GYW6_9HYPH
MNKNAASKNPGAGKSLAFYAVLALLAIVLDQWIKYGVETSLPFQEKIDILPFLALFRTFNTGIAFSMLSSFGDTGLIVLSLAVSAFIVYMAIRSEPHQIFARLGFALILGGAIGNVIDRVLYGHVVDYILFHTQSWSFAVFNLADAFISVGAAMVVLEEFITWRRQPPPPTF